MQGLQTIVYGKNPGIPASGRHSGHEFEILRHILPVPLAGHFLFQVVITSKEPLLGLVRSE